MRAFSIQRFSGLTRDSPRGYQFSIQVQVKKIRYPTKNKTVAAEIKTCCYSEHRSDCSHIHAGNGEDVQNLSVPLRPQIHSTVEGVIFPIYVLLCLGL